MRNIVFPIFVFTFLVSCQHRGEKEFEVSGTIKNSSDRMVYMEETPLASGERIVADSAVIGNDGSYHLKAKASEESLFSLFVKSDTYPFAYIINDATEIIVNADARDPGGYEVKGSSASKSLKDFSLSASEKWGELYRLGREKDSLKEAGASDTSLSNIDTQGESQLKSIQNYVREFIRNSSDPITSMWALGTYQQVFSVSDYNELLTGIAKKFPNHKGVAAMKEISERQLALQKQKSQEPEETQWINKQAPELSLPDVNGNEVKLSSFRGKYVLVDFWASWCLPCRRENPNVVSAYNKYKNKNFTILGVSLDKEKSDWIDAIQADKLSWTQVSDLKEWNSLAVSIFDFNGIPFNILIDPEGKVIAQSLRGDELENKLHEVLR